MSDDDFGLKRHMMKPYPSTHLPTEKLVFNYRLSSARTVIENVFAIMSSRFRIFHRPILAGVNKVKKITKAAVVLHNFFMAENHNQYIYDYCPSSLFDHEGLNGFRSADLRREMNEMTGLVPTNNFSRHAKQIRDSFKDYFNNEGAVECQWQTVNRV